MRSVRSKASLSHRHCVLFSVVIAALTSLVLAALSGRSNSGAQVPPAAPTATGTPVSGQPASSLDLTSWTPGSVLLPSHGTVRFVQTRDYSAPTAGPVLLRVESQLEQAATVAYDGRTL